MPLQGKRDVAQALDRKRKVRKRAAPEMRTAEQTAEAVKHFEEQARAALAKAEAEAESAPALDENHWNTLQELLNAVAALPGVYDRVEAYMIAREIENPKAELKALHKIAFA